jgi:FlaG/FlaF family flagellin (archaellin)
VTTKRGEQQSTTVVAGALDIGIFAMLAATIILFSFGFFFTTEAFRVVASGRRRNTLHSL